MRDLGPVLTRLMFTGTPTRRGLDPDRDRALAAEATRRRAARGAARSDRPEPAGGPAPVRRRTPAGARPAGHGWARIATLWVRMPQQLG